MYDTLVHNVSGSRAGTMFRINWLATKFQNINEHKRAYMYCVFVMFKKGISQRAFAFVVLRS